MVLDYDTWYNQKLPCGILIEFWKLFIYLFKYLSRSVHSKFLEKLYSFLLFIDKFG
jgi:hypothetical protein